MNARQNDSAPTVSVLLPVYNGQKFLREAIESVLAQTFEDFELLALDDGSTDGSLSVLREYEAKNDRVHVFSRENQGLVPTLNELVSKARGNYLARMDADDICQSTRLEKQVAFLDAFRDHVLVGGWCELMTATGMPIGIIRSPASHGDIDKNHLRGHTSICHPVAMFRRTSALQAGWYSSEFDCAEDLDLWLRLAEIGKVANLPEVLLQYRLHPKSISEAKGRLQQDAMRRACEAAWRRRGIKGQFEAADHWRPGRDKASHHKYALQYGWVAWSQGNRKTWWAFASEALRLRPLALSSWRLLIFGSLKRPHRDLAPKT